MVPFGNSLKYNRHSGGGRNPDYPRGSLLKAWIPAFAGMTVFYYIFINRLSFRKRYVHTIAAFAGMIAI